MDDELFDLGFPWRGHWIGMPEFDQQDLSPWATVPVHFRCREDLERFAELLGQRSNLKAMWYPPKEISRASDKRFTADPSLNPRYPIYVPSRDRWETCYTMRSLDKIGVPYKAVIEEHQARKYERVLGKDKVLTQPRHDKGLVVTRNWIWDHAQQSGAHRFWTFDDNIGGFYRMYKNIKTPITCGNFLRCMEEFVERYENVVIAGMHYFMFFRNMDDNPPFTPNTRVYSNMLIQTDVRDPRGKLYRNEGFFNDDTDLCLRVLKDGLCTVLFNAFLILKHTTMAVKGGMTGYYQGEGRYRMAKELRDKHPDVVTITKKWGRWQHHVDYKPFRRNRLIPRVPLDQLPLKPVDNFGMHLERNAEKPLLLIGQAPSRTGDRSKPLEGRVGRRLARLAGITEEEYLAKTERVNLFDKFTGRNGKGDLWNPEEAKRKADGLRGIVENRRVVFLGRNVAAAFGLGKMRKLTWKRAVRLRADVALIPHPSGIVRWWNEERNKRRASRFLREALKEVKT